MEKGIRGLFIILLIVLSVVVLFFVFKRNLLSNNDTDFSDLVCIRSYPETEDKEIITIKFDKDGISREYVETQVMYFSSEDEAKAVYNKSNDASSENVEGQINLFYDSKMELENNTIKSSFYFNIEKGQEMYNKTKEELSKYYETEYMYECEG